MQLAPDRRGRQDQGEQARNGQGRKKTSWTWPENGERSGDGINNERVQAVWESDVESCRISLKEAVPCGHGFSLGEQGSLENKESDWRDAAFAEE